MAYQLPYHRDTFKPSDELIPGNANAADPVEFDLLPAEGPDLARIKSVLVGTAGLVRDDDWSPAVQNAVIGAFETGAKAFDSTVAAVRGLTVPAAMAKRVGIIQEIPTHVPTGGSQPVPNHEAPIPISSGVAFGRICGFMPVLALVVASEIVKLSNKTDVDPRFFVQPSGSGIPATGKIQRGSAKRARRTPEGSGTAANLKEVE